MAYGAIFRQFRLFMPLFQGLKGRHDTGDPQHEDKDFLQTHRS
jgi:hypothetical protein